VAYQLASVTVTTFLKAGLFTLLLLPDLRCVWLGLIGVFLAMLMLEMLRIAVDIATWGMSRSAFLAYRTTVVAGLVAIGFAVGSVLVREDVFGGRINFGEGFLVRVLHSLVQLNDSVFAYAALSFEPFIDLILADRMTATEAVLAVTALAIVTGLAAAVIGLHTTSWRRIANRERRDYRATVVDRDSFANVIRGERGPRVGAPLALRLTSIARFGGAGALAWR
jgi:hypothetical protein